MKLISKGGNLTSILSKVHSSKIIIILGICVPILECVIDDDCSNIKYCELNNNTCGDPCVRWPCGVNAYGTPLDHRLVILTN